MRISDWSSDVCSSDLHDSSNFRWFGERYERFFYIDRIVVATRRRGGGLGRAFYADVQSYAELRYPQMACEVFVEHDSDPARVFHGSFGFHEVGQPVMPGTDGEPSGIRSEERRVGKEGVSTGRSRG